MDLSDVLDALDLTVTSNFVGVVGGGAAGAAAVALATGAPLGVQTVLAPVAVCCAAVTAAAYAGGMVAVSSKSSLAVQVVYFGVVGVVTVYGLDYVGMSTGMLMQGVELGAVATGAYLATHAMGSKSKPPPLP